MRLSDFVIDFITTLGVNDIFLVSGGGNMHLIDAVGRNKNVRYICNHHEQACTVAAEGYARLKNDIGVAIVTTGPGGTNALSGVAGAWLDSIPMLVISGQVKLADTIYANNTALRQFGDQELNIIDLVKPITKYSVMITDKNTIKYHLGKAVYLAKTGRPGPVWIDIPLDIQALDIDPYILEGFDTPLDETNNLLAGQMEQVMALLANSERPLIIAGNGIRLSHGENEFLHLLNELKIPVVTAINGNDLVNDDYEFYTGRTNIMGHRGANFAVQNSDLIISIGSRLCLRQVSFNYENFAREAKIIMVDVDDAELSKKSLKLNIAIKSDAKVFIESFLQLLSFNKIKLNIDEWRMKCVNWNKTFNGLDPEHIEPSDYVNSYYFVSKLSNYLTEHDHVITSNGTSNVSTLYSLKLKGKQRLITNTAFASMGYGLPASIGACIANNRQQIVCMENDGSLQMNIQELQTIVHYRLPIKLIVFNNDGYLSIKLTQSAFFPDNITASNPSSGVSCPDLEKIAFAYGIPYVKISHTDEIDIKLEQVFSNKSAYIIEIMMDPWQNLVPKTSSKKKPDGKMISKPIEDMFPFLPREIFYKEMIIEPIKE